MKTTLNAYRLSQPIQGCDFTVMIRTVGANNVDVSLWLNDEEALRLAAELRAAVANAPECVTLVEAA
jgi:hypothetical protein